MGPSTRHPKVPHPANVTIGQREEIISRSAANFGTHTSRKFRDHDSSFLPASALFLTTRSTTTDGPDEGALINAHEPPWFGARWVRKFCPEKTLSPRQSYPTARWVRVTGEEKIWLVGFLYFDTIAPGPTTPIMGILNNVCFVNRF